MKLFVWLIKCELQLFVNKSSTKVLLLITLVTFVTTGFLNLSYDESKGIRAKNEEDSMKTRNKCIMLLCVICLVGSFVFANPASEAKPTASGTENVILRFYFPIGTAGDLANLMNKLCAQYSQSQPNVIVEPIFAGDYVQTMQRTLTSSKAGNPPDLALLTSADVWTAVDEDIIIPLQPFIDQEGQGFMERYFQGFLEDAKVAGNYYAIPFQKSTPIFYFNKSMLKEAGLDPNKAPETWAELKEMARKLTIPGVRYGVEIPIDQWLMGIFIMQNGGQINNLEGNLTYLDTPEAIEAMEFILSMVKEGLMPAKRLFGDSSADFVAGKTAMMYNSTGSMTFVRNSASFDWGVGYLPANKKRVVATGGGQFVISKNTSPARQMAAWNFIKWMSAPEQTAQWSMGSGFVAVSPEAFELPVMKEYTAKLPQALVARDQLEYAVGEPPKTHEARQIAQLMSTTFESILAGKISSVEGMKALQVNADRILSKYR